MPQSIKWSLSIFAIAPFERTAFPGRAFSERDINLELASLRVVAH